MQTLTLTHPYVTLALYTTYQSLPRPLVASVMVHRQLNRPRTENAPETLLETSKACRGKRPR